MGENSVAGLGENSVAGLGENSVAGLGENSVAGLGEASLAGRAATSRAGRWRWRFGVAALLIDLGTRGPPTSPDHEHDRHDQAGHTAGHQDDADSVQVQVRGLPGDAPLEERADDDETDTPADRH